MFSSSLLELYDVKTEQNIQTKDYVEHFHQMSYSSLQTQQQNNIFGIFGREYKTMFWGQNKLWLKRISFVMTRLLAKEIRNYLITEEEKYEANKIFGDSSQNVTDFDININ